MKHRTLGVAVAITAAFTAGSHSAAAQQQPAPPPGAGGPAPASAPASAPQAAPAPVQGGFQWGGPAVPQPDTGRQPAKKDEEKPKKKLPWRGTSLAWSQTASAYTLGVGKDFQSRNPSYDMAFTLTPRYYLLDEEDHGISVRGSIGAFREFTNSDTTTDRGEWSLEDATLTAAYARVLHEDGDYVTDISFRTPNLSFPTSKASANNGKILGIGASLGAGQAVPILGSESPALQTFGLQAAVGYTHTFTEATTPTNGDLDRVRLTPDGASLPGDQLSGATRARHQVSLSVAGELGVADKISWANSFSWQPSWKYQPTDAKVCADNLLPTGCAEPGGVEDPQEFSVVTGFDSSVNVAVIPQMSIAAGYSNLTLQNGPDGKHRNMLYSPAARFYLTVTGKLDEIYQAVSSTEEASARRSAGRRVARSTLPTDD